MQILSIDRRELKTNARDAMHGTKPRPFWVALVLAIILLVLQLLTLSLNGNIRAYQEIFTSMADTTLTEEELYDVVVDASSSVGTSSFFGWFLVLAMELMRLVLNVGFTLYTMRVYRRVKGTSFGDLFDSFGVFFRALWITIMPELLVWLWSLVYIIPAMYITMFTGSIWGVIVCLPLLYFPIRAFYGFRLSTFLMLDNHQRSCGQCVAMSRMVMQGRRWELFKLDISFLGWYIISIIPFVNCWVKPYVHTTRAEYYDAVMREYLEKNGQNFPPMTWTVGGSPSEITQDEHEHDEK